MEEINIKELKQDLIDYFTGAAFNVSPVAFMDLTIVESASDEEVIKIALDNGFNLNDYIEEKRR